MDEENIWAIYFAGIASIRFHPRNDNNVNAKAIVTWAAEVADAMLSEHHKRWPVEKEE